MQIGQKIKLQTFNGENEPPEDCEPSENYWLLIGKTGTIVDLKNEQSRVLIQFDEPVNNLGLHCHNSIPNSLLILSKDLEIL
jgi:hypothetical protein